MYNLDQFTHKQIKVRTIQAFFSLAFIFFISYLTIIVDYKQ
jgi:hypothetical protein